MEYFHSECIYINGFSKVENTMQTNELVKQVHIAKDQFVKGIVVKVAEFISNVLVM